MVVPSVKDLYSPQSPSLSKFNIPTASSASLFFPHFAPPPPLPPPSAANPFSPSATPHHLPHTRSNMLGLNPHISGPPHPFQSMLPGLHHAAVAAAAGGTLPHGPPIPPHNSPHAGSVAAAAAAAAAAVSSAASAGSHANGPHNSAPGGPNPLQLSMWPLIWNHITNLLPQLSIAKMDPLSQVFCLRWNNHRNNLLMVFDHLLQTEAFCDVTLACDGASVKCHKMILSACSSYFQQLFMENQCEHPIVFLKDIKYDEIRAILDYMYKGEVNVAQDQLPGLLKVAELLKVKGLVEEEREKLINSNLKGERPIVSTSDDNENRPRSSSSSGTSKINGNDSSKKEHSPPSTSSGMRPFMYTPPAGGPSFPMWPLQGMFPHNLIERNRDLSRERNNEERNSEERNERESSPGPKEAKRKKTASGSAGSNSSKESGLGSLPNSINQEQGNAQNVEIARAQLEKAPQLEVNDLSKEMIGQLPPGMEKDGSGIANYVPNQQRLEWKRYKQYTRNDIMAAIEEVKKGMSALQASRKYGVPSRTLYDKVKKMGITTGRQMQRKSLPNYPASFPSLSGMMGMDYSDRMKDMDDNTNESSGTGESADNRATMVPTPGFPALQMLNLMEKMKGRDGKMESEISLTPMNLSTMLSNSRNRDFPPIPGQGGEGLSVLHAGRLSDSSMSPNGGEDDPDLEEEEEGMDEERNNEATAAARERKRHTTADIRAQFMADLKRLGGNIPTQSSAGEEQTASSTTGSPPPPALTATAPSSSSPHMRTSPSEDSLPPRKRKVSQEHRMAAATSSIADTRTSADLSRSPLNGVHSRDDDKPRSNHSSTVSSPIKDESSNPTVAAN